MEPNGRQNYERLWGVVRELPRARTSTSRKIHWLESPDGLGIARDSQGRIEIFIAGAALRCTSPIVAANVSYNEWERADERRFSANRLVLASQPHFDAVAAFLCTYLLDSGFAADRDGAFRRTEPVVEMAFERSRMLGDTLVGLLGELIVLRALVVAAPARASEIVDGWFGHVRSARDVQLSNVGVEVKTTTGSTSMHPVSGIHQIEAGHGVTHIEESRLFLASVGVEPVPPDEEGEATWTLPLLLESFVAIIRSSAGTAANPIVDRLLVHVRDYGEGIGQPYDHKEMNDRIAFSQTWRTTFARFYDMDDDAIDLPRSGDLGRFSMLDPDSISFTIRLPNQVNGDLNPVVGLSAGATQLVSAAWSSGL